MTETALTNVFWEGCGLSSTGSGVAVAGARLKNALQEIGIHPKVVGLSRSGFSSLKAIAPVLSYFEALQAVRNTFPGSSPKAIFHGLSNFNLPWLGVRRSHGFKFVLTVHDLIPLLGISNVSRKLSAQLKLLTPMAFKVADAIVCSSEWSKRTVVDRYPEVATKVQVIRLSSPLGIRVKRPTANGGTLRVLSVGRSEDYKRLPFLLSMVSGADFPLVLDIVTDLKGKSLLNGECERLGLLNRVTIHSALREDELSGLYEKAEVYVQPSLYEGYCLPAAEAMAYGIPVVYCTGSAVDELVGPLGLALAPDADRDLWLAALVKARRFAENPDWALAVSRGRDALSTWQDCAFSYAGLYAKLLE